MIHREYTINRHTDGRAILRIGGEWVGILEDSEITTRVLGTVRQAYARGYQCAVNDLKDHALGLGLFNPCDWTDERPERDEEAE